MVHGFVESPERVRGHGGGFLDGDVVDVVTSQELEGSLEPAAGFAFAQDGLAQQVHVQVDAVLLDLGDGRAELGVGGVHDQVAHHVTEDFAGDRDDHLRQDRSHDAAGAHGSTHVPGQERRDLRGKLGEVAAGDGQVLGADDAVDESHRELQAVRVLEDAGEALGGNVNGHLRGFGRASA